jgi:hypothetical protein
MRKIQAIPLVALLVICFCFAQCHKDKSPAPDNPYGLPNATQREAGVFARKINGVNLTCQVIITLDETYSMVGPHRPVQRTHSFPVKKRMQRQIQQAPRASRELINYSGDLRQAET